MRQIERFGGEWAPLADALLRIEEFPESVWFDPRKSIKLYSDGDLYERKILLEGEFSHGTILLKYPDGRWFDVYDVSILNSPAQSYELSFEDDYSLSLSASNRARSVYMALSEELARQISTGHLVAAGRIGGPLADIVIFPPDAWTFLDVQDWVTGLVIGPDGGHIYGCHIMKASEEEPIEDTGYRPITKVQKVSNILGQMDLSNQINDLTLKEMARLLAKPWTERYPLSPIPSADTLRRARDLLFNRASNANDA